MSNENKKPLTSQFIAPYGPKIKCGEHYVADDDTTDQRAPVNDPSELYDQFVFPGVSSIEDFENEELDDFENDFTDYDDISEYGEDIAKLDDVLYQQRKFKKSEKESKLSEKSADDKKDEEPAE